MGTAYSERSRRRVETAPEVIQLVLLRIVRVQAAGQLLLLSGLKMKRMMLRNFCSPKNVYRIRAPGNFYVAMRADVKLLLENKRYIALTTVIMCCLDALAADPGDAGRGKFGRFMKKHFPDLCTALDSVCPGRKGADVLYDKFRNGFAHNRGPKSNFLIVEDQEVDGDWVGRFPDLDGKPVGINVDRLAKEFLKLLDQLERNQSLHALSL